MSNTIINTNMNDEKANSVTFNEVLKTILGEKLFNISFSLFVFISIISYIFIFEKIKSNVSFNVLIIATVSYIILFIIAIIAINLHIISDIEKKNSDEIMKKIKDENSLFFDNCRNCAKGKVEDDVFLSYYNLVPFNELLKIEKNLKKDDIVIIYTSHLDTESPAEEIVTSNINKGVLYSLLYYNGDTKKVSELKRKGYKDVFKMPKHKNSFDSKLSDSTGFDMMLYKSKNYVEAFFCVNFSVGTESCLNAGCPNRCDRKNSYLFYKRIEDNLASSIYEHLSQLIKKSKAGQK